MRKEYKLVLREKFAKMVTGTGVDFRKVKSPDDLVGFADVFAARCSDSSTLFIMLFWHDKGQSFCVEVGRSENDALPELAYVPDAKQLKFESEGRFRLSRYWSKQDPWWIIEPTESLKDFIDRGYQLRDAAMFLGNIDVCLEDVSSKLEKYVIPCLTDQFSS